MVRMLAGRSAVDLSGVVREKIDVGREPRRPFDLLDVALDHLQGDHGAVRIELLRRHDRAREHVAVVAVLGGDLAGEIVDLLQRDGPAEETGVEFGELRVGVDGGADDPDPADDKPGLLGPRRGLDAGLGDDRTARLRQWDGRRLEALALAAGLIAGRHDLGPGSVRYASAQNADHRRSHREGAHAGEHVKPTPQPTGYF